MRAAARAARSQSPEESELVLRLWARRTATALRAFGVDDDGVPRRRIAAACRGAGAGAGDRADFHWLNALAREFEWTPILLAMDNDARRAFITDGLRAARNATRAFTATLAAREVPCRAPLDRSSPKPVASAPDADASDDALLTFVRHASEHDAEWTTERATSAIVRRFLDAAASRLEAARVRRLARLLPWVLPPADMSGGDQGRAFIATVIEDARRNVENRRVGLDGSTLALLAACFSRGDDLATRPRRRRGR